MLLWLASFLMLCSDASDTMFDSPTRGNSGHTEHAQLTEPITGHFHYTRSVNDGSGCIQGNSPIRNSSSREQVLTHFLTCQRSGAALS